MKSPHISFLAETTSLLVATIVKIRLRSTSKDPYFLAISLTYLPISNRIRAMK